ncbi:hypothetical protein [Actinoplanes sp. NPDC023714]|uniref:hypothetical protein n=1 Tax=Actinoplanes sp. NPDC023714 TaxID=3154322 RepID=UPI0033C90930
MITRGGLLRHPRFPRTDLVRYADAPHREARALVVLDPGAPAALIDRLRRDEHPGVRAWMADDPRLGVPRVIELLDDEELAAAAARNPNLPVGVMERGRRRAVGTTVPASPRRGAARRRHGGSVGSVRRRA